MNINKIEIIGRVYKATTTQTNSGKSITKFGLQFWNGKKDDKNTYAFIDVVIWDDIKLNDKDEVIVKGYLKCNEWEKDGKKLTKLFVNASEVKKTESQPAKQGVDMSDLDDELPPY